MPIIAFSPDPFPSTAGFDPDDLLIDVSEPARRRIVRTASVRNGVLDERTVPPLRALLAEPAIAPEIEALLGAIARHGRLYLRAA